MPKLHTTLEPGDVVLVPAGSGASIQFMGKAGRRSRVVIESNAPVTLTRASESRVESPTPRLARKPVPTTS